MITKFIIERFIPLIEKHWRLALEILLIVLLLFFFWRSRHETSRANEAEEGRDAAIKISNGLSLENRKYKNKQGETVLVTKVVGIPKSQVDELIKQEKLSWLKKLEGVNKSGSNLESAATFSSEFLGGEVAHDTVKIPCLDSLRTLKFHLKDQWNDIEAVVIGFPKFDIRDRYYAAISLHRPKGWFWKFQWSKREAIGEITNSNKLIKIDSAAVIKID